eukprot:Rmarinus@m.19998
MSLPYMAFTPRKKRRSVEDDSNASRGRDQISTLPLPEISPRPPSYSVPTIALHSSPRVRSPRSSRKVTSSRSGRPVTCHSARSGTDEAPGGMYTPLSLCHKDPDAYLSWRVVRAEDKLKDAKSQISTLRAELERVSYSQSVRTTNEVSLEARGKPEAAADLQQRLQKAVDERDEARLMLDLCRRVLLSFGEDCLKHATEELLSQSDQSLPSLDPSLPMRIKAPLPKPLTHLAFPSKQAGAADRHAKIPHGESGAHLYSQQRSLAPPSAGENGTPMRSTFGESSELQAVRSLAVSSVVSAVVENTMSGGFSSIMFAPQYHGTQVRSASAPPRNHRRQHYHMYISPNGPSYANAKAPFPDPTCACSCGCHVSRHVNFQQPPPKDAPAQKRNGEKKNARPARPAKKSRPTDLGETIRVMQEKLASVSGDVTAKEANPMFTFMSVAQRRTHFRAKVAEMEEDRLHNMVQRLVSPDASDEQAMRFSYDGSSDSDSSSPADPPSRCDTAPLVSDALISNLEEDDKQNLRLLKNQPRTQAKTRIAADNRMPPQKEERSYAAMMVQYVRWLAEVSTRLTIDKTQACLEKVRAAEALKNRAEGELEILRGSVRTRDDVIRKLQRKLIHVMNKIKGDKVDEGVQTVPVMVICSVNDLNDDSDPWYDGEVLQQRMETVLDELEDTIDRRFDLLENMGGTLPSMNFKYPNTNSRPQLPWQTGQRPSPPHISHATAKSRGSKSRLHQSAVGMSHLKPKKATQAGKTMLPAQLSDQVLDKRTEKSRAVQVIVDLIQTLMTALANLKARGPVRLNFPYLEKEVLTALSELRTIFQKSEEVEVLNSYYDNGLGRHKSTDETADEDGGSSGSSGSSDSDTFTDDDDDDDDDGDDDDDDDIFDSECESGDSDESETGSEVAEGTKGEGEGEGTSRKKAKKRLKSKKKIKGDNTAKRKVSSKKAKLSEKKRKQLRRRRRRKRRQTEFERAQGAQAKDQILQMFAKGNAPTQSSSVEGLRKRRQTRDPTMAELFAHEKHDLHQKINELERTSLEDRIAYRKSLLENDRLREELKRFETQIAEAKSVSDRGCQTVRKHFATASTQLNGNDCAACSSPIWPDERVICAECLVVMQQQYNKQLQERLTLQQQQFEGAQSDLSATKPVVERKNPCSISAIVRQDDAAQLHESTITRTQIQGGGESEEERDGNDASDAKSQLKAQRLSSVNELMNNFSSVPPTPARSGFVSTVSIAVQTDGSVSSAVAPTRTTRKGDRESARAKDKHKTRSSLPKGGPVQSRVLDPEDDGNFGLGEDAHLTQSFRSFLSVAPKGCVRMMNMRSLSRVIHAIYIDKINADLEVIEVAMAEWERSQADSIISAKKTVRFAPYIETQKLVDFVTDFHIMKYGLRALVGKHLRAMLLTCRELTSIPKISDFIRLMGIFESTPREAADFYLRIYSSFSSYVSTRKGKKLPFDLKDEEEQGKLYVPWSLLEDTWASLIAPVFEGYDDLRVRVARAAKAAKGTDKLEGYADAHAVLHECLDCFLEGRNREDKALRTLFRRYDVNRSGGMSFDEFERLSAAIAPRLKKSEILSMYKETLKDQASDELDDELFIATIRRHGLAPAALQLTASLTGTRNILPIARSIRRLQTLFLFNRRKETDGDTSSGDDGEGSAPGSAGPSGARLSSTSISSLDETAKGVLSSPMDAEKQVGSTEVGESAAHVPKSTDGEASPGGEKHTSPTLTVSVEDNDDSAENVSTPSPRRSPRRPRLVSSLQPVCEEEELEDTPETSVKISDNMAGRRKLLRRESQASSLLLLETMVNDDDMDGLLERGKKHIKDKTLLTSLQDRAAQVKKILSTEDVQRADEGLQACREIMVTIMRECAEDGGEP